MSLRGIKKTRNIPINLEENKIKYLLEKGKIIFNRDTLAKIRDNYINFLCIFIENNLNRENDIRSVLDDNDLISILDSEIKIESKKRIVKSPLVHLVVG